MPIISSGVETEMVARYQIGMTAGGSPVFRQKSFSGLKMDVTDEDLYEVATTLFDLLEYPLISVTRNNRMLPFPPFELWDRKECSTEGPSEYWLMRWLG